MRDRYPSPGPCFLTVGDCIRPRPYIDLRPVKEIDSCMSSKGPAKTAEARNLADSKMPTAAPNARQSESGSHWPKQPHQMH